MYNRYIPQPDGSYRKNRVSEPQRPPSVNEQRQRKQSPQPPEIPCPPPSNPPPPPPPKPCRQVDHKQCPKQLDSITGFFKQLLPKDMDTADLLIILLLLLMAGDCEEEKNNTLLTLALYFLM